jgi:hypothetical protein
MAQQQQQLVWFQLVDSTGSPFKGTSISSVSLPPNSLLVQFRDAVKAKYADSHLKGVAPSDLLVYENKDKEKQFPLKPSQILDQLTITDKDALIVVVPTSEQVSAAPPTQKRKLNYVNVSPSSFGSEWHSYLNSSSPYLIGRIKNRYRLPVQCFVLYLGDLCKDLLENMCEMQTLEILLASYASRWSRILVQRKIEWKHSIQNFVKFSENQSIL